MPSEKAMRPNVKLLEPLLSAGMGDRGDASNEPDPPGENRCSSSASFLKAFFFLLAASLFLLCSFFGFFLPTPLVEEFLSVLGSRAFWTVGFAIGPELRKRFMKPFLGSFASVDLWW